MVTDEEMKELQNDILRQIYEEAEPGLDFDDLLENPDEYPDDWYDQHRLSDERQEEIRDEQLEKHGIDGDELPTGFWMNVIAGYSPLDEE